MVKLWDTRPLPLEIVNKINLVQSKQLNSAEEKIKQFRNKTNLVERKKSKEW